MIRIRHPFGLAEREHQLGCVPVDVEAAIRLDAGVPVLVP